MLTNVTPVSRLELQLYCLPDWPRWSKVDSSFQLKPGQLFKADAAKGKSVLGVCLSPDHSVTCSLPTESILPVVAAQPDKEIDGDWRLANVAWRNDPGPVDVCSMLDGDYFDKQYTSVIFGLSFSVFVKSCIVKARVGNQHSHLRDKLLERQLGPDELEQIYRDDQIERDLKGFQKAMQRWEEDLPTEAKISEAKKSLQQRETFLQVIIGLELMSQDDDVESQYLDHHFDRLCIWQTLDLLERDSLKDFLVQAIYPFYKTLLPTKVQSLSRKIEGPVSLKTAKPKLRRLLNSRTKSKPARPPAANPVNKALEKTLLSFRQSFQLPPKRSLSFQDDSHPSVHPSLAKRAATIVDIQAPETQNKPLQNLMSRELSYHQSRQIDVKFSRVRNVPAESPKPQAKRRVFEGKSQVKQDNKRRAPGQDVVMATPRKQRVQMFTPQELNEEIDSTDSD